MILRRRVVRPLYRKLLLFWTTTVPLTGCYSWSPVFLSLLSTGPMSFTPPGDWLVVPRWIHTHVSSITTIHDSLASSAPALASCSGFWLWLLALDIGLLALDLYRRSRSIMLCRYKTPMYSIKVRIVVENAWYRPHLVCHAAEHRMLSILDTAWELGCATEVGEPGKANAANVAMIHRILLGTSRPHGGWKCNVWVQVCSPSALLYRR